MMSMFGDTEGKRDAVMRFTKPVTGGYYLTPALAKQEELLGILIC